MYPHQGFIVKVDQDFWSRGVKFKAVAMFPPDAAGVSITDFINALSSSSLHPSSFAVEDSRCLLFTDFSSNHNFFHFVSCRACSISYGQPWPFRLLSATWYVEPLTFFFCAPGLLLIANIVEHRFRWV
jgi:hypothetical protein